jgi:glyoxylase-like metal-dependent hydrolase (beta-lactamase superfamily II)
MNTNTNIEILRVVNSVIDENTYIVYNARTLKGFVIDPGSDGKRIEGAIKERGLDIEAVLLTHGHFDHALSAKFFQDKGIRVYIHKDDEDKIHSKYNLSRYTGYEFRELTADIMLNGGEILNIAGFKVETIHTPGHSKGGLCYLIREQGALFSGDTLFLEDIGRSDFYDGNYSDLKNSIVEKLFVLDGKVKVYPGHDESTTIGHEREHFKG